MSEPDPLIAAIRRRFQADTAKYGVAPPGDTGPLLREIDRLQAAVESGATPCTTTDAADWVNSLAAGDYGVSAPAAAVGSASSWTCVCNYMNGGLICTHCGRSEARSTLAKQRTAAAAEAVTVVPAEYLDGLARDGGPAEPNERTRAAAQRLPEVVDRQPAQASWARCPNGSCPHSGTMHDVEEMADPKPRCCADGCDCGSEPVSAKRTADVNDECWPEREDD